MAFVLAKCPQCGGNLEVDNEKDAAICKFCNSPFVVEKAINNYNTFTTNNYEGATIHMYDNPKESADSLFDICMKCCEKGEYEAMKSTYSIFADKYPTDWRVYYVALLRDSWSFTKMPKLIGNPVCEEYRLRPIVRIKIVDAPEIVYEDMFFNKKASDEQNTNKAVIYGLPAESVVNMTKISTGCCLAEEYSICLEEDVNRLKKWADAADISKICKSYDDYMQQISSKVKALERQAKEKVENAIKKYRGSIFTRAEYDPEVYPNISLWELRSRFVPNMHLESLEKEGNTTIPMCKLVINRKGVMQFAYPGGQYHNWVSISDLDSSGKFVYTEPERENNYHRLGKCYLESEGDDLFIRFTVFHRSGDDWSYRCKMKWCSGSGRCYIATAVYGSYDCPEVWVLRRYRDYYLKNSSSGRLFIRLYLCYQSNHS